MRALIIDDSQFTRRVLRGLLERRLFECSEARDAEEGLDVIRSGKPFDIALVDWTMPGMSGLEMVKELRVSAARTLKIMMVTSHCESESIREALQAGADEYLMKPFDGESLGEKLALMGLEDAA